MLESFHTIGCVKASIGKLIVKCPTRCYDAKDEISYPRSVSGIRFVEEDKGASLENKPVKRRRLTPVEEDVRPCEWEGQLDSANEHLQSCSTRSAMCKNPGCGKLLVGPSVDFHARNCPMLPGSCECCNVGLTLCRFQTHVNQECVEMKETCSKCGESFRRGEMDKHLENACPEYLVICTYPGCYHMCKRSEMESHVSANVVKHVELLKQVVDLLREEQCRLDHEQVAPMTVSSLTCFSLGRAGGILWQGQGIGQHLRPSSSNEFVRAVEVQLEKVNESWTVTVAVTLCGIVKGVAGKFVLAWKRAADGRSSGYVQEKHTILASTDVVQLGHKGGCVWSFVLTTDRVESSLVEMGEQDNPLVELLCQSMVRVEF